MTAAGTSLGALTLTFLTDSAVGRGEGTAGVVDAEVETDPLGLPLMGGKTLHGLLRDSWLQMAPCFPQLEEAAVRILGPEGDLDEEAILHVGDAMADAVLRAHVARALSRSESPIPREEVLGACTAIRQQTAQTRRGEPERGTLRATRVLRAGQTLVAPLHWLSQPDDADREVLRRATAGVRHVGLGRNRGLGVVALRLEAARESAPEITPTRASVDVTAGVPAGPGCYVPVHLELEAPAVLTGPAQGANRVATLPYAPGSTIRGALAALIANEVGEHDARRDLDDLVLSGKVRFLNAHPTGEGRRSVPRPLSFHTEKRPRDERERIDAIAIGEEGDDLAPDLTLVPAREPFVRRSGAAFAAVEPSRTARLHHQRDRTMGRAWTRITSEGAEEPRGALFSYESLSPNQELIAFLQIVVDGEERGDILERLRDRLHGRTVLLGRSRRAGYGGRARVQLGPPRDRELDTVDVQGEDLEIGARLRALLLAPYIGRDPRTGQQDPVALECELTSALGGRARIVERVWTATRVQAFNRHWGAPVPTVPALAGGSVLLLAAEAPLPAALLRDIEHQGLGERREEGFGRIAFLRAPELRVRSEPALPSRQPSPGPMTEEARRLQHSIARARLERALDARAAEVVREATRLPAASLLARIRTPLQRRPEIALARLEEWLTPVKARQEASEPGNALREPALAALRRCRVPAAGLNARGAIPLDRWLAGLARPDDENDASRAARIRRAVPDLRAIVQRSCLSQDPAAIDDLATAVDDDADANLVRLLDGVLGGLMVQAARERAAKAKERSAASNASGGST